MSYIIHGIQPHEIPGQLELFPEWYEEQREILFKEFWDLFEIKEETPEEPEDKVYTITTVESKQ